MNNITDNFNNLIENSFNKCDEFLERASIYYKGFLEHSDKLIKLFVQNNKYKSSKREDENKILFIKKKFDLLTIITKNFREIVKELKEKDYEHTHFYKYLLNEFINFNWNGLSYFNDFYESKILNFNQKIGTETIFNEDDFTAINAYYHIFSTQSFADSLINKVTSLFIFNKIKHINNNIVMIGANGSGKSTFARNLKGKLGTSFAIISAQHLLIYKDISSISLNNFDKIFNFQNSNKLGSDNDLERLLSDDFSNLVKALFEENQKREHKLYVGEEEKQESILSKVIKIWNELIPHRRIINPDSYQLEVECVDNSDRYNLNKLSDGEKAVFYYIGHVLFAEKDSYIVIDEPENHLHHSICSKLWNRLEESRPDCKFIYITHNLDFAVSRNNKTIIWNKKFVPPSNWEFEELKPDDNIPDVLMLEILGSRKSVIFCEGDSRNSLDYKIYSHFFSNYDIIPVGGHESVISYCRSFNKNFSLTGIKAFGIIDGDAWSEEEKQAYEQDGIMILPYNEIENFLCDEIILDYIIESTGCEQSKKDDFKSEFFDMVTKEKEALSTWYAKNKINNYMKHNLLKEEKDIHALKQELNECHMSELLEKSYNEKLKQLDDGLQNRNYKALIKTVNLKKRLSRGLANKHIVNNYEERVINLMRNKDFEDLINNNFFSKYCPIFIQ